MSEPAKHERFDVEALSSGDRYRLMTDIVAPRPIAWVSTLDADGRANLAPFSYFQGVCTSPPMVMLAFANRPDGRPKDTLANILARRELTINHVSESLAEAMNVTSGAYEPGVDEWDQAGKPGPRLDSCPSASVAPPRVAAAVAALECRMTRSIPLGQGSQGGASTTLVLAQVQVFWVTSGLAQRDGRGRLRPIDPAALASVGRLGGMSYARTADTFDMVRPTVDPTP
ncbi:MAG: flavin reductase family protein [Deltaproteobacteria bacterium]|nr:flavin reductase family protein [Deltaproteobacteria bacterium]